VVASIAADNASNAPYDNGWQSGDNGGTGFGAWSFVNSGSHSYFIGSSTDLSGPGANINVSGESFGMFGGSGGFADAARSFSAPLAVNQAFSIDLAVNFRNGNKGIDLRNSSNVVLFNFNVGSDDYRVNSVSIGSAYSANTAFRLTFVQTSASGGSWTVVRSGGVTDTDSGTYSGVLQNFKLYVAGTDGGAANNLYANNMSISAIPEPTAALCVPLAGLIAGGLRSRRVR
jgi:hypothetical protein